MRGWLTAGMAMVVLGGCGGSSEQEPTEAAPSKTVFDPMTSQLDQVKEQAETLPRERKEALDSAIDGPSQ